jgi:hypothetical protein
MYFSHKTINILNFDAEYGSACHIVERFPLDASQIGTQNQNLS